MEIQGGLTVSKPAGFGPRASVTGTRVGQKLSHLTTRRVIIGNAHTLCCLYSSNTSAEMRSAQHVADRHVDHFATVS